MWTADSDRVVIDLARVPLVDGWTRKSRSGLTGIEYNRDGAGGRDGAGERGVMCFPVRAREDGGYYFTAISYAPHNTEHNDAWVRSDKGFTLWRQGRDGEFWRRADSSEWLKAYQNSGGSRISEDFKTRDHDGHRFIIPNVRAGETFNVCISGRSFRYELFKLALIKCEGRFCTGGIMQNLRPLASSQCVA